MTDAWFTLSIGKVACRETGKRVYRVDFASQQQVTARPIAPLDKHRAELHKRLDAAIDMIDAQVRFAEKANG